MLGLDRFRANVGRRRTLQTQAGYRRGVAKSELPYAGDDQLNAPTVTPDPAPADDRLVKLAALGGALSTLAALVALRWLKRNVIIRWRR